MKMILNFLALSSRRGVKLRVSKRWCLSFLLIHIIFSLFLSTKINAIIPPAGQDFRITVAEIGTEVDALLGTFSVLQTDFSGTFTAIAAIPATNFSGTYTALAALRSDLDSCCSSIEAQLATFSANVATDFNGTFTALAALSTLIANDFNGTFTAIAAIPAANFSGTYTALAALSNVITNDFNGTFTAIAAISSLITTDFNGTFTAIAAIPAANFSGTYTALAALSNQITTDFNNTMTVLGMITACLSIPLYQSSVNSSQGILITATGADYCFSQNITGSIIISNSNDITLNLNSYALIGVIEVKGTAVNTTIKNGYVTPAAPLGSVDAAHAAILINSGALNTTISNCNIICTAATNTNGRDGIDNAGNNTAISSCVILAGNATGITNGSNGGNAISQQANNGKIVTCTVTGGVAASGGTNGAGIFVTAPTNNNLIELCTAANGGGNGYTLLTTGTVNLVQCFAYYNAGNGFDASGSTGKGLVNYCISSQNIGCGFNDLPTSLYQYISCVSEGNGATPAGTADTNYCLTGTGATYVPSTGLGNAIPYIQRGRIGGNGPFPGGASAGVGNTFPITASQDNITLS